MRNVGCKDDDIKLLIAKKFLIPFDSGVVVIKHWRIHNYIQKDRFTPTKYQTEKAMLSLDENKSYTQCIQAVYSLDTQVRIGKESIDKESIDKESKEKEKKDINHKYGEYDHVLLTDAELERLIKDYGKPLIDKCITFLDEYIEEKAYKSKSHNLAIRRWVIEAVKKKNPNERMLPDWYQEEEKEPTKDEHIQTIIEEYKSMLEVVDMGITNENVLNKIENLKAMYKDLTGKEITRDVK